MHLTLTAVRRIACALAAVCWLMAMPALADELPPVRIGVLSHRGADVTRRMWSPMVRYLAERIPEHRFELVPLDYDSLLPAVEQARVDFTFTAAGQYVELELRHGVTRVATVMSTGPNGDFSEYGGVFVTRADRNDIVTLADLRGKTILIPDELSFGGWQMQRRELRELGLESGRDYSIVVSGDNEKSLLGVVDGKADVGTARSDMLERLAQEGRLDPRRLRVLSARAAPQTHPYWVSTRLYPEWPFAKLRHTPDALARRVLVALLTLPRDSEAARAAQIVGWTVPKDYQSVHELLRELRLGSYAKDAISWREVFDEYQDRILAAAVLVLALLVAVVVRERRAGRRLAEEKARSETYLDLIGTMIVVLDRSGRVTLANRRALAVMGYAEAELLGKDWFQVAIPPAERDSLRAVFDAVMLDDREISDSFENEVLTARGERRRVRWSNRLVRDDAGHPASVISAGEDVTEQRQAGREIRLFAQVFEGSAEGVIICDARGDIVTVNPAFTEITGFCAEEVVGRNPRLLASGRQDAVFYRRMWTAMHQDGRWQGEVWNRRKDGTEFPEWLSISVLRDARGTIANYIGIFSDISQRKADQERIHFLAFYDALTELPNRTLLANRFEQAAALAQRNGRSLALLFIDLDRFKQVNDSLGHPVGDELLKIVAARFAAGLRESDTLARQGGDEFILLLPELDAADDAVVVAEKCIDSLRVPAVIGGHELRVSPSIGIAVYPQDGESLDALVKAADTAMYAAKDAGRNTWRFFTAEMNARIVAGLLLETEMRRGLERGEFILHFQPQVDIASGDIVGIEALLRWQHPQRGLVYPGDFIARAEESGLIVALGDWALREACRQNAIWQRAGLPPVRIAVNVSAAQFRLRDFYAGVTAALRIAGLEPRWLELELTESLLIEDADETLVLLHDLKALGVCLALDDFGTGYSSLSYLKRFPMDKLKVDQSFVGDLTANPEDHAIAASIIALGHHLGLRVVAEGVETAEQLDVLAADGCDEFQGYYFSRPLAAAAIETFVRARAAADDRESAGRRRGLL